MLLLVNLIVFWTKLVSSDQAQFENRVVPRFDCACRLQQVKSTPLFCWYARYRKRTEPRPVVERVEPMKLETSAHLFVWVGMCNKKGGPKTMACPIFPFFMPKMAKTRKCLPQKSQARNINRVAWRWHWWRDKIPSEKHKQHTMFLTTMLRASPRIFLKPTL